jgi:hypothetical protein
MERFRKPLFAGIFLSLQTNNTLLCEGHASRLASYMSTHALTHTVSVSCCRYLAGLTATSRLHY